MRFLTRGLVGLVLAVLTLGLLVLAAGNFAAALRERSEEGPRRAGGAERAFAVNAALLTPETVVPEITAYGTAVASRTLELRAAVGGTVVELAPGFRDGGRVVAGELMWRVDPAEARAALGLAEGDLADAEAELREAEAALMLVAEETAVTERQRALRAQARDRYAGLRDRGLGTEAELETAELALSAAEAGLVAARRAEAVAEARIARGSIALTRARLQAEEAARRLAETEARAPFAGVLTEVAVVPGRLVGANEKLGVLVDPEGLEVAFGVSNAEYVRLAAEDGAMPAHPVLAELALDGAPLVLTGRIERVDAAVGAGQSGRMLYARLEADRSGLLRPGDFLTVRVPEPALRDVAVIPAAAASPAGRILVLGADERLEEVTVRILRRQGDRLIVAGAPFGREYVTERQPQLGPGVLVRPIRPEAAERAGEPRPRGG
jgi:multidrug efflux pump subunit AcrA (membrane-fusion protein)